MLLLIALGLLSGCESRTDYGSCVGLGEDQNPKLHYRLSAQNVVIGIVFFELLAPPIIVATNETFCPTGPAEFPP
jgi:hypothetical protein